MPIAYCPLPIAYCLLPIAYCPLPIAHWLNGQYLKLSLRIILRIVKSVNIILSQVFINPSMLSPNLPEESGLLKAILEPLLEDLEYWFQRSQHLLETEKMSFLTPSQQADLLYRVTEAQREVSAAKTLFQATGGQVGIEMAVLMPWHQLLTECWRVASQFRMEQANPVNH